MKNCKSILFVLGFLLLSTIAATPADAPNLTFKFTKVNVPGAFGIVPLGVNNKGVIVGYYYDKSFLRCGPVCSVHLHRGRHQLPFPAYFISWMTLSPGKT